MADKVTLLVHLEQIEKGIDNLSQKNVALQIKLLQAVNLLKDFLNCSDGTREKAERFIVEYEKSDSKIHINTTTISDAPLMEVENDRK